MSKRTQRAATITTTEEDPSIASPKFALNDGDDKAGAGKFSIHNGTISSEKFLNATTLVYVRRCAAFQIKPDPSVLAALETQWHVMQISPNNVEEGCLLPLVDVLSSNGCAHVRELRVVPGENLRDARAGGSSGDVDCRCLSKILSSNKTIVELDIAFLGVGTTGMDEIASIVKFNTSLRRLRIAHNPGGRNNYLPLIEALRHNTTLRVLDVSYNHLGHGIITQLRRAGAPTAKTGQDRCVRIDAEGNHVVEEAINALTHFMGLVVAICAVIVLMGRLSHASLRVWWSTFTYSMTLLAMFSCSTIFHASTNSPHRAQIANIFDHAAIFLLVAGSCSPFLHIALEHSERAWIIAIVQWCMAMIGIAFNLYGNHSHIKRRQTIEMILYFSQALVMLFVRDELAVAVGSEVTALVWMSGITYAVGSIFFVAEHAVHPIGHGIWHLFVCVAAMFHWRAVYIFVQDTVPVSPPAPPVPRADMGTIETACHALLMAATGMVGNNNNLVLANE